MVSRTKYNMLDRNQCGFKKHRSAKVSKVFSGMPLHRGNLQMFSFWAWRRTMRQPSKMVSSKTCTKLTSDASYLFFLWGYFRDRRIWLRIRSSWTPCKTYTAGNKCDSELETKNWFKLTAYMYVVILCPDPKFRDLHLGCCDDLSFAKHITKYSNWTTSATLN